MTPKTPAGGGSSPTKPGAAGSPPTSPAAASASPTAPVRSIAPPTAPGFRVSSPTQPRRQDTPATGGPGPPLVSEQTFMFLEESHIAVLDPIYEVHLHEEGELRGVNEITYRALVEEAHVAALPTAVAATQFSQEHHMTLAQFEGIGTMRQEGVLRGSEELTYRPLIEEGTLSASAAALTSRSLTEDESVRLGGFTVGYRATEEESMRLGAQTISYRATEEESISLAQAVAYRLTEEEAVRIGQQIITYRLTQESEVTMPMFIGCRVFMTSAQSINPSSFNALSWGGESFDPNGMHSTATNPTRLTIPNGYTGKWRFTGQADLPTTAISGSCLFQVNGSSNYGFRNLALTSAFGSFMSEDVLQMTSGDYIEFFIAHNNAGAKVVSTGEVLTHFTAEYLGT